MTLHRSLETVICAVVICLITAASHASAQDTAATGSFSGAVTSSDGTPAPGVVLCFQASGRCVTTGGDGKFRVADAQGQF